MKQLDDYYLSVDEEDTVQMILVAVDELEKQFSVCAVKNDYSNLYAILHDYCYKIIGADEKIQVFAARHGFLAVLSNLIRKLSGQNKLSQDALIQFYETTKAIESWETLSDFFLNLPWFVEKIRALKFSHPMTKNEHVNDAIRLINENLANNDLTVFWLAEQLHITTTHMNNLFKMELDQTVSRYINQRVVEEIIYELTYNQKSLKQVRKQFGFTSASHFSQFFKRQTNMSPLQYIKNNR